MWFYLIIFSKDGPAEICIGQREGFLGEFYGKCKLCFFIAIQFISLNLFFFSFSNFVRILFFDFLVSQINYLVREEECICVR